MGQRGTVIVQGRNSLQHNKLKAASNCDFESQNKLRLQFDLSKKVGLARHPKLMDLQHSPIKTLPRKNLAKKKKKGYNILVFLQVPYDCLIKTFQRKNLWEKTLAKEKEYNQYIIFWHLLPLISM